MTRVIPLEGCFNFRDLGGYRGAGGRQVRWRILFRADGLSRLTPADAAQLAELGLRTVIDLRTEAEVSERGRIDHAEGRAYHHLPLIDVLPPSEDLSAWGRPEYVADQYATMLASGAGAIGRALAVLGDAAAYPAAFHCMAGKDRTGILSALVLGLVGVGDDDIVADYALSREAMVRMLERWRADDPDRAAQVDEAEEALVAVDPAAMARFLAGLRARHGSIDGFVAGLGLPDAGGRLRDILLEA